MGNLPANRADPLGDAAFYIKDDANKDKVIRVYSFVRFTKGTDVTDEEFQGFVKDFKAGAEQWFNESASMTWAVTTPKVLPSGELDASNFRANRGAQFGCWKVRLTITVTTDTESPAIDSGSASSPEDYFINVPKVGLWDEMKVEKWVQRANAGLIGFNDSRRTKAHEHMHHLGLEDIYDDRNSGGPDWRENFRQARGYYPPDSAIMNRGGVLYPWDFESMFFDKSTVTGASRESELRRVSELTKEAAWFADFREVAPSMYDRVKEMIERH